MWANGAQSCGEPSEKLCLEYTSESLPTGGWGDRSIYPLLPISVGRELTSRDANIPSLLGYVCVWLEKCPQAEKKRERSS